MPERKWWNIQAEWAGAEENSYLLFELNIRSMQIITENVFECYFEGDDNALENFKKEALALGVQIKGCKIIENQNWLEKCQEIWQPVVIEKIRIIPVLNSDSAPAPQNDNDIFLIPGEGFGTGHHATTRFIIEILQSIQPEKIISQSALDVGCGSGILALAIEKIFAVKVDAIDNDPAAVANAQSNLRINNSANIKLSLSEISQLKGKYGLIAANIYAEVLRSMKPEFERLLSTGGFLVLSGIISKLSDELEEDFKASGWKLKNKSDNGEWVALLLEK